MAQVINTGGSDSGTGVLFGVLLVIAVLVGGYFLFMNGNIRSGDTVNIDTPDVRMEAPTAAGE